MMKKYIAVAIASLVGLAGVATAAGTVAHHNAHKHEAGFQAHKKGELPRDLQELNLSSKQKTKIEKIIEANRPQNPMVNTPEMQPNPQDMTPPPAETQAPNDAKRAEFQKKMEERRMAEQKLVSSKSFDEAAARRMIAERHAEHEQNATERQQKMADMEIKRLKERHDIFQILTPKQQQQWLENQKNRRPHLDGKRAFPPVQSK